MVHTFIHLLNKIFIFRIKFKYISEREKLCWSNKECFCLKLFINAIIGIYLWWWIPAKGKRRYILCIIHNFLVYASSNVDERPVFRDDENEYSVSLNRRKIFLC